MNFKVQPFLMFEGKAEEAMRFYESLFPECQILDIVRYGPGSGDHEGTVMKASFSVGGQTVLCTDSFVKHAFTFTPAFSLFITCDSEDEFRRWVDGLLEGGEALMPLDDYGFGRLFAWVNDRYGVSWQLNLV